MTAARSFGALRWIAVGLAAVLVAMALVTVGRREPSRQRLVLRFIPDAAEETFDTRVLAERVPVFSSTFGDARDLSAWQSSDLRDAVTPDGLQVRFRSRDRKARPRLTRRVDFDAETVDAIEVEVAGPRRDFRLRGELRLSWSGPRDEPDERRSLVQAGVDDIGDYAATYSFDLRDHPEWKGKIRRLRLEPLSDPDETLVLRAIRGVRYEARDALLDAALQKPWKVALSGDQRGVLLAPPGRALRRTLRVPPNSSFSFSYGVPRGVEGPVRFAVSLETAQQPTVDAFEATLDPGRAGEADVWHEGSVDLSRVGGKEVTLALSTSSAPIQAMRGLPVWGNPEVWERVNGAKAPPNIVLVSLDTLRADHLSLYGYPRSTTPLLDAWARRRAAVFENAVAPSPWTIPSHVSLFTGQDALRHGVNQLAPPPRSLTMMAERLRKAGYATVAVTGGGYLTRTHGFDRGFDSFTPWQAALGADASEMAAGVDRSLGWLQALSTRPFFLFLHTYAVHAPYRPRQPYFGRLAGGRPDPPEGSYAGEPQGPDDGFRSRWRPRLGASPVADADLPVLRDLYDAGVAYADEQLARVLDRVRTLDLEGRTVAVVTSDHGEALGEHGLGGHGYLYDFNLAIPLVVSLPDGRGAGRRVSSQVRLVDVLPTLLELAGVEPPEDMDGSSLVPLVAEPATGVGREAWSYASSTNHGVSLRTPNGLKYIFNNTAWPRACGEEELYRLGEDPGEERSVAGKDAETDEVRRLLDRRLKTWSNGIGLRFTNGGGSPYSGSVAGPFLHQISVKTLGRRCGVVAWNERAGRVDYTVRPGESFDLVLEGPATGPVTIRAERAGAREGFEVSIDPLHLSRPRVIESDGRRWREGESASTVPATGIVVTWVGEARPADVRGPDVDPAARERLRALGYGQ